MLSWLGASLGTIVVCIVLACVVCAIVMNMIKNKKNGKSPCGCSCEHCHCGCAQKTTLRDTRKAVK